MDELRTGLELATREELAALAEVLFRPKFNPLDYWCTPSPQVVQGFDRHDCIERIESRFRYLAADGLTVLRKDTHQVSYRQVLLQLSRHLKLEVAGQLSTLDLEAEIFLQLLEKAWHRLTPSQQTQLQRRLTTELAQAEHFQKLSPQLQKNPLALVLKGSGAVAVSSVIRPWLLQQIAKQFALQLARYQVGQQTLRGAATLGAKIQGKAAVQLASRGMVLNTARYGAVRGVFAFLGPALWAWFIADLGWRAIASNYTRVIPVVFTLAQIRLIRGADSELLSQVTLEAVA
ncbi:MAG: YaaW family protein [Leptolyngbyaceae cyanobacterium]